jgi:uncharacterized protein (DUF1778 family)
VATRKKIRSRPVTVKVMVTQKEKAELKEAADLAGMGLSVFIRATALEVARKREKA